MLSDKNHGIGKMNKKKQIKLHNTLIFTCSTGRHVRA